MQNHLTLRPLTSHDLNIADEIACAAYNTPYSRKTALNSYIQLQPGGWFMAFLDAVPVGFGGLVDYGPFAYLGMMSVLPAVQRHGIGHALMVQLMAWADARNCPTILLDATEAGAPLYTRFGFIEDGQTAQWLYNPPTGELPVPLRQGTATITPLHKNEVGELAVFDMPYFGANRAAVFSTLEEEHPQRAFVARNYAGEITGYIFAQSRSIGPWVAVTAECAEQLLAQVLTLPFPGDRPYVNVSVLNSDASELLTRYGFHRSRVLRHMRRGQPTRSRNPRILYAQTSFALG